MFMRVKLKFQPMKKNFILLMGIVFLASCQDNMILSDDVQNPQASVNDLQDGMQRIVASSPEDIQTLIAQMGDGSKPLTRAISSATLSNNKEPFVSLIEANRIKVMESLTPLQLDSIANDEEELEFCPSDSVSLIYNLHNC